MARTWILIALLALAVGIVGLAWFLLVEPPAATLPSDVPLDHTRPRPQGGFYRCPVAEPRSLSPFVARTAVARQYVLDYTHDALLDFDPADASLRPALAREIPELTVEADGTATCTFTLRDGLCFDHGGAVKMADVLFTYRAATGPKLIGDVPDAIRGVDRIEPVDARRFRVVFGQPHFAAVQRFGVQFRIVDAAWYRDQAQRVATGDRSGANASPLEPGSEAFSDALLQIVVPGPATGPYRLRPEAWRPGVSLVLTQNPRSWRREAQPEAWNLAGIQLLFDPELGRSVFAALNQRIDYLTGALGDFDTLLDRQPRLAAHYRLAEYQKSPAALLLIVWNAQRPPFDDARVRRAMTMLFDRSMLVDVLFDGHARVATSWFPPDAAELDPELQPLPFDPERAARLLEEAGIDRDSFVVDVLCPDPSLRRPLLLARPAFGRAGVRLEIRDATWENTQRALGDGDFAGGVILYHNHGMTIDPSDQFHSARSASFGGYSDTAFDAELERASSTLDPAKRLDRFRSISRQLAAAQPITPLAYPAVRVLLHRRFQGAKIGKMGLVPERWWVKAPLR